MSTLYDEYGPNLPERMPMYFLYKRIDGELSGRTLQFAGANPNLIENKLSVWFIDIGNKKLYNMRIQRDDLNNFVRVSP